MSDAYEQAEPRVPYTFRLSATDHVNNAAQVEAEASTRHVTKYYYFGGQRVAVRQPEGVYYLHADHLGSTSLTTNGSGEVVARQLYHPYGTVRWSEGALPTDFTFTGQRDVPGTGLVFMHARFYHPSLGRFVSADTIVPEPGNPQSLNRYTYVNNRPLLFADPSGHCGELTIDGPLCKERERDISSWPGWAQEAAVASCSLTGGCRVREKADGRTVIRSGGPELCMEALESQVMGLANPIAAPAVGLVDDFGGGLVGHVGRAIKKIAGEVLDEVGDALPAAVKRGKAALGLGPQLKNFTKSVGGENYLTWNWTDGGSLLKLRHSVFR